MLNILCRVNEHMSPIHLKITDINFSKSSIKINWGITVTLKSDLCCLSVILLSVNEDLGLAQLPAGMFLRVLCWDWVCMCMYQAPHSCFILNFSALSVYMQFWKTFAYKTLKVVKILN